MTENEDPRMTDQVPPQEPSSSGSSDAKRLPLRACVGLALFNREGRVFIGRRIDRLVESWQMPQGGIDPGETPQIAAFRELREEIGTDKAEIIATHDAWISYELPGHLVGRVWRGRYRGQRQKWLALRFTGEDRDINVATAEPEFDEWRWAPLASLPDLIVPFKRDVYETVVRAFQHLATPTEAD